MNTKKHKALAVNSRRRL